MSDVQNLNFDNIYASFQPKVFRYVKRMIGPDEADDLTQEVFIKVNKALNTFKGKSKLSTWIYRIATNTVVDRLRSPSFQYSAKNRLSDNSDVSDSSANPAWPSKMTPSPDKQLIRKEMNSCIRNFVERLPDNYRAILVLSEMEGLKNNEIAEILGITLHTVKIRLHRARTKLKKELEAQCNFYHDERNELACDLKKAF